MKKHWLYGERHFIKEVDEETSCAKCFHVKVCSYDMEKRCVNFDWGSSRERGCGACHHHYARFDKDSIPCFHCEDFVDSEKMT